MRTVDSSLDIATPPVKEGRRLRILLASEYSPFTPKSFGAQQRTLLLWNALQRLGDVDLLLLRSGDRTQLVAPDDPRVALEATYRVLPGDVGRYFPDRRLTSLVDKRLPFRSYDVVCSRHLSPVARLDLDGSVPVVVDLDDANYVYASSGSMLRTAAARCKGIVRRVLERRALRRFHRFWFVTRRDRQRFPRLPGAVLPNIPLVTTRLAPSRVDACSILFVGALWYGPNVEGMDRFLARVWPLIRAALPKAELVIVGGGPRDQLLRWAAFPGVKVPGFVDDLAEPYERCALAIAPIYSGGGTNIKLLESLAYGRTCVATPFCATAFEPDLVAGTHLLVGESDQAFAAACIRLLTDPAERERLALLGHEAVSRHFSTKRFNDVVAEQIALAMQARHRSVQA